MRTGLLFVHALSPLHAGTGQSVGAVDLPIARDRATGYPYMPGSGLKGSLRGRSYELKRPDTTTVFGPETTNAHEHAGALAVGDANLVLLPVRSVAGTFAYATSPWLLARFARDAKEVENSKVVDGVSPPPRVPEITSVEHCIVAENTILRTPVGNAQKIVFEDLDLSPQENLREDGKSWAGYLGQLLFPGDAEWQSLLSKRFCIVHDDVMGFFSRYGTDVVTRVAIDRETGTAKERQLWNEESLPVETVLSSLLVVQTLKEVQVSAVFEAMKALTQGSIQLGGKGTVGRGRCRLVLAGGAA